MPQVSESSTLFELVDFVRRRFQYTEENYPQLARLANLKEQQAFAVKHAVLHMNKSLGKIAAEVEAADHGGEMNIENLQIATAKMLVNVLSLSLSIPLYPGELAALVPKVMKSK